MKRTKDTERIKEVEQERAGLGSKAIPYRLGQESFHDPLSNAELAYVPITPPYVCSNNKTGEAANKRADVSGLELVILLPTLWSAEIADVYHHTRLLTARRRDLLYSAPVHPSGSITSLPYGDSSNKRNHRFLRLQRAEATVQTVQIHADWGEQLSSPSFPYKLWTLGETLYFLIQRQEGR